MDKNTINNYEIEEDKLVKSIDQDSKESYVRVMYDNNGGTDEYSYLINGRKRMIAVMLSAILEEQRYYKDTRKIVNMFIDTYNKLNKNGIPLTVDDVIKYKETPGLPYGYNAKRDKKINIDISDFSSQKDSSSSYVEQFKEEVSKSLEKLESEQETFCKSAILFLKEVNEEATKKENDWPACFIAWKNSNNEDEVNCMSAGSRDRIMEAIVRTVDHMQKTGGCTDNWIAKFVLKNYLIRSDIMEELEDEQKLN